MKMQALFQKRLQSHLAETGLSVGQPKVVAYLKGHDGQCQKEIAQACLLEPGSLSVLLRRMEDQRVIRRQFEGEDRKTRYVYLTDRGHELADEVIRQFYLTERSAFNGFTEEEERSFLSLCDRMIRNLQTEG